jgi:hypothetical protein
VTAPSVSSEAAGPRWSAIIAVLCVFGLIELLPERYKPSPGWFPAVGVAIAVAAMLAVMFAPQSVFWHRVERAVLLLVFAVGCTTNILSVGRLVGDMITHKHGFAGIILLESGAVIWVLNVVLFALLYWQVGAGEKARGGSVSARDFKFAEDETAETSGWDPSFIDYLFLAFATSTSFTPPDYARPGTRRAKLVVMLQALISLTTLVIIASRAIATLS